MKIIFFADLHVHPFQQHAYVLPSGVNSRLQAGIDVFRQICDHAMNNNIENLVCAGDLFHWKEKLDVVTFNSVVRLLADYPFLRFYMIPGNHDMASHDGSVHALEPFKMLPNVTVFSDPVSFTGSIGGIHLALVPYMQTGGKFDLDRFKDAVSKTAPKHGLTSVLVSHCYTHELMKKHHGLAGNVDAEYLAKDFDMVLLGHHHIHDTVVCEGRQVVSIGAPIQQRISDAGMETGFLVLNTVDMSLERVRTHGPEFAAVDAEELDPEKIAENFVRVRVSSKQEEERVRAELEKLGAASVAIEVIPASSGTRIDIAPGSNDSDLIDKYLSSSWGKTKLDHSRLKELALSYLGGAT